MNKRLFIFALSVTSVCFLNAQTITIQPYLQDASPHSISILWETDSEEESIVEWGPTEALGNQTLGIAYPSSGDARVHEVQLENLERFTKYYYRVKTGPAVSDIFAFKTPPFASDHESFRMVAMSDMQKDNSHPNKFQEIVEEGVIDYLEEELGGELIDHLALVLIPGDLVVDGNNFGQWKNDFFNPSEQLFSQVPLYPVLGNHENNSAYYFTYFKLPDNGTTGFEEHWWYKDYGNVRIIGLNSNGAFASADQLNWLDNALDNTCAADSIDFVFAQLHHPHKSELWTPGESDFTGEVIERLEQFSTDCQKPSIHFFGHTHGYSRGQSRDHKHLWINVATAGGAIDNWGEFPNFDYDEFSVSQDDYGFVVVEVSPGPDPSVTVKRISRGDQDAIIDNVLTDSLTIRKHSPEVNTPVPIFPIDEEIAPECVTLQAGPFSTPEMEAAHGQSHWQVTTYFNGFDDPVAESWKNFENWYFEEDTQAGDDLTDEDIVGLEENTTYLWRVRYRDREMNWSEWSEPVEFTTGESIAPLNLLLNPGAEEDLSHWTLAEGVVEALTDQECNGVTPYNGEKYFAVGGLCDHSDLGRATQDVDVSMYADSIDAGALSVNFGGYLSNYSGADLPEMRLLFYDHTGMMLGESNVLSTLNASWTLLSEWMPIPGQTRTIQLELKGTRNTGTDNDSYFDELFLKVSEGAIDCTPITSTHSMYSAIPDLTIAPNPFTDRTIIQLPSTVKEEVYLQLIDAGGRKVAAACHRVENTLELERGNLAAGTYLVIVRVGRQVVGAGKVVVTGAGKK
jgi:hypothetical protein